MLPETDFLQFHRKNLRLRRPPEERRTRRDAVRSKNRGSIA